MYSNIFSYTLLLCACFFAIFFVKRATIFSFFCLSVFLLLDVQSNYLIVNYLDVFLFISVIVFIVKSILNKKAICINKYALILSIFLGWAIISLLVNQINFIGIKRLLKFILRFSIYIVFIPAILKTERDFLAALKYFIIGGSMIAIGYMGKLLVFPSLFKNFFLNPLRPVPITFLEWSGHELGHYMSILGPLLLALTIVVKKNTAKMLFVTMLCATAVLGLSLTKSAWVGFILGLILFFYYINKYFVKSNFIPVENKDIKISGKSTGTIFLILKQVKRKVIKYTLFVFLICVGFFMVLPSATQNWLWANFKFHDVSGVTRLRVWKGGLNMFINNIIFGVGFYNFEYNFKLYDLGGILDDRTPTDPHNWWIRIGAETGLPGLLIFGLFCYIMVVDINRIVKEVPCEKYEVKILGLVFLTILISIFVQGFFEATFMWSNYIWALFSLAIIYIKVMERKS